MHDTTIPSEGNSDCAVIDDYSITVSLAKRLESFAATLSPSERNALKAMLTVLEDPLQRRPDRDIADLLEPHEIEILKKLQDEGV